MKNQETDIRWIQRFNNFKKALSQLSRFIEKSELNDLERQGIIKSFEYTYELGWNTLKDYLEYQGDPDIKGSRDTIQKAFKVGLIMEGESWMEMFKSRNQTSHTYNEKTAREISDAVFQTYHNLFVDLKNRLDLLIG